MFTEEKFAIDTKFVVNLHDNLYFETEGSLGFTNDLNRLDRYAMELIFSEVESLTRIIGGSIDVKI